MSKVICDICGTSYQDTADSCPICGYSRDLGAAFLDDDFLLDEELTETAAQRGKGGRFSNSKKKKEIFDYDEVNPEEDDLEEAEYPDDDDDEEYEYEEEPRHNTFLVVLLVVLIMVLLAVAGYIFLRYFMPNVFPEETTVSTTVEEDVAADTTEFAVPCTKLILTSCESIEITEAGYYHLINVIAQPEDTTDELVFASADESIATVSDDGRVTAVSEGETTIYITCGSEQLSCKVICSFADVAETSVPEETTAETSAVDETDPADETTPAEETAAAEETKASEVTAEVTLKLKDTDIRLGVGYGHTILLDCDLKHEDIEWRIEHEYIAKVDDKGFVTALANGTTAVIAKYGDQEVQCILRCYSLW